MVVVGFALWMAAGADAAEDCKIAGLDMASSARDSGVPAGCNRELRVVEHALIPGVVGVPVAILAGDRESGGCMVWIARAVIIGFMASVAVAWSSMVHAVLVACFAGDLRMSSGEHKERIVIERGLMPIRIRCFVACFTIRWESGGSVIGIARGIVVGLMASVAGCWSAFVSAVYMTRLARQRPVLTYELEEFVVIEAGIPVWIGSAVAIVAGGREACCGMVRIPRGIVIRLMASVARGWCALVFAVLVARFAGDCVVDSDKLEEFVVIEFGIPVWSRCLVARFAICGEACGSVIGLARSIVIGFVAAIARARRALVSTVFVARLAGKRSMLSYQREHLVVIEPVVPIGIGGVVAVLACSRKAGRHMIGLPCCIVVDLMTAVARSWSSFVLVVLVAGAAGNSFVPADKRENVVVIERGVPIRICGFVAGFTVC